MFDDGIPNRLDFCQKDMIVISAFLVGSHIKTADFFHGSQQPTEASQETDQALRAAQGALASYKAR
jgi:hypothetical protein